MMGEDTLFGLIGIPNMDLFANFKAFIESPADGFTDASYFVFNLVFCATTATIDVYKRQPLYLCRYFRPPL